MLPPQSEVLPRGKPEGAEFFQKRVGTLQVQLIVRLIQSCETRRCTDKYVLPPAPLTMR